MSLRYLFDPNIQFQGRGGVNNVNGFLRVYINGTDDRATTYSNFSGTYNEPDIVLDTDGRAVVIVDDAYLYRIEVYNDLGGLLWTVSDYSARGGEGGGSDAVSVEGTEDEIDVYENTQGGIKHFVLSLSSTIKNAISSLSANLSSIALAVNGKKDRQNPVFIESSNIKTVKNFSQDDNGNISMEFEDIAFPDWTSEINDAVANCEKLTNKKTSVTGNESSNTFYPTIKAMVDFVEAMVQNLGGKLITDGGDAFTDATDLPDTTPFDGVNIQDKDYAYVQGTGFASRYSATVAGSSVTWIKEYEINIPVFTPSQQAAIDSGVTAEMLDTFLTKTGDGKDVTVTYTPQSSGNPANISSGSKLSAIFAKIQYWFTKFGSLAWKNTVTNSDISGTIADSHIASANAWNNALCKDARYDTTKSWLKIGTISSQLANVMYRGVTLSVEYRANDGNTQSGLLWISAGEYKASGDYGNDDIVAEYNTIGRRTNTLTEDVKFYVKSLGTSSTSGVEIYAYLYNYSELSITPLNVPEGSYTPEMTYVNDDPTDKKEVTYSMLLRSPYGTSKGSATNPVYIDDKGNVQPCDNAKMTVGGANNAGYAAIAGTAHALDTAQGASNVPVYFGADGRPLKAFSIPSRLWVSTTINDNVNGYSLFHPCKLFDSGTVLDSDKYFQYRVKVRNGFIKIIFRWTSNVNTLYSENKVNGNVVWSRLTGTSSTNVDVENVAKSYTNVSSGSDMEIASFELSSNQSYQNIRSQGMVIIDAYQESARILGTRLFLKFDFNFIKSAGQNTSVDAILDSELYVIGI